MKEVPLPAGRSLLGAVASTLAQHSTNQPPHSPKSTAVAIEPDPTAKGGEGHAGGARKLGEVDVSRVVLWGRVGRKNYRAKLPPVPGVAPAAVPPPDAPFPQAAAGPKVGMAVAAPDATVGGGGGMQGGEREGRKRAGGEGGAEPPPEAKRRAVEGERGVQEVGERGTYSTDTRVEHKGPASMDWDDMKPEGNIPLEGYVLLRHTRWSTSVVAVLKERE